MKGNYVDNTQNIISFCTGYGGIELGIKRTGLDVRTIAYVEIEAFAVANLVAKIEQGKMDAAPIWTNLKTFDGEPFRGKVHGIIGGYPCQPFSIGGRYRLGTQDPRHLWPYIEKHIRAVDPIWCFFENVEGHLGKGFDEVLESLRRMGFAVEAGLFGTKELGFDFDRPRLFILAYSESRGGRRRELASSSNQGQVPSVPKNKQALVWCETKGHIRNEPAEGFKSKPLLDRRVDGSPFRLDRIRLCGNGVVPEAAELAFRTLWSKLNQQ